MRIYLIFLNTSRILSYVAFFKSYVGSAHESDVVRKQGIIGTVKMRSE